MLTRSPLGLCLMEIEHHETKYGTLNPLIMQSKDDLIFAGK